MHVRVCCSEEFYDITLNEYVLDGHNCQTNRIIYSSNFHSDVMSKCSPLKSSTLQMINVNNMIGTCNIQNWIIDLMWKLLALRGAWRWKTFMVCPCLRIFRCCRVLHISYFLCFVFFRDPQVDLLVFLNLNPEKLQVDIWWFKTWKIRLKNNNSPTYQWNNQNLPIDWCYNMYFAVNLIREHNMHWLVSGTFF